MSLFRYHEYLTNVIIKKKRINNQTKKKKNPHWRNQIIFKIDNSNTITICSSKLIVWIYYFPNKNKRIIIIVVVFEEEDRDLRMNQNYVSIEIPIK